MATYKLKNITNNVLRINKTLFQPRQEIMVQDLKPYKKLIRAGYISVNEEPIIESPTLLVPTTKAIKRFSAPSTIQRDNNKKIVALLNERIKQNSLKPTISDDVTLDSDLYLPSKPNRTNIYEQLNSSTLEVPQRHVYTMFNINDPIKFYPAENDSINSFSANSTNPAIDSSFNTEINNTNSMITIISGTADSELNWETAELDENNNLIKHDLVNKELSINSLNTNSADIDTINTVNSNNESSTKFIINNNATTTEDNSIDSVQFKLNNIENLIDNKLEMIISQLQKNNTKIDDTDITVTSLSINENNKLNFSDLDKDQVILSLFHFYIDRNINTSDLINIKAFYQRLGIFNNISDKIQIKIDNCQNYEEFITILLNEIYPKLF